MTSGASTTRSRAPALRRWKQSSSVINTSSKSRSSGSSSRRRLHMIYEQDIVHKLYRKLLTLYPRTFHELLGESMEQTFHDLWNEKRQTKKEFFGFVLWTFIETAIGIFKEHLLLISPGDIMQTIVKTFGSSVLISFLLILPFMIMEVINRRN